MAERSIVSSVFGLLKVHCFVYSSLFECCMPSICCREYSNLTFNEHIHGFLGPRGFHAGRLEGR